MGTQKKSTDGHRKEPEVTLSLTHQEIDIVANVLRLLPPPPPDLMEVMLSLVAKVGLAHQQVTGPREEDRFVDG